MSLLQSVLPIYDINNRTPLRKRLSFPQRVNPMDDYDDSEFYDRFRFSKGTFSYICGLLREDLTPMSQRQCNLSPELQLCMALRFYASGSFLEVIGDTVFASKSAVSKAVTTVTNLLVQRLDEFVEFPKDAEKIRKIENEFYDVAKLPGIVGAIDGTQVKIQAPSGDQEPYYVNRKGYHSINVQAICDTKGKFLNVVADWPGSTHDSRILQMSHIGMAFAAEKQQGMARKSRVTHFRHRIPPPPENLGLLDRHHPPSPVIEV